MMLALVRRLFLLDCYVVHFMPNVQIFIIFYVINSMIACKTLLQIIFTMTQNQAEF